MHVNDRMALMGHASAEMTDRYTQEDRERMRAGVETISNRIWKPEKAINVIDIASIRNQKKKNSGNQLATRTDSIVKRNKIAGQSLCLRSKRSEVRILSGVPTLEQNQLVSRQTSNPRRCQNHCFGRLLKNFDNQSATTPQSGQTFTPMSSGVEWTDPPASTRARAAVTGWRSVAAQ